MLSSLTLLLSFQYLCGFCLFFSVINICFRPFRAYGFHLIRGPCSLRVFFFHSGDYFLFQTVLGCTTFSPFRDFLPSPSLRICFWQKDFLIPYFWLLVVPHWFGRSFLATQGHSFCSPSSFNADYWWVTPTFYCSFIPPFSPPLNCAPLFLGSSF